VRRARKILNSPAKWNRADNRECPATQRTYSLYCALEKATEEVSKKFEHRGAAIVASGMFATAGVQINWRTGQPKAYEVERPILIDITSNTPETFHRQT
jgi:hypothetical protein